MACPFKQFMLTQAHGDSSAGVGTSLGIWHHDFHKPSQEDNSADQQGDQQLSQYSIPRKNNAADQQSKQPSLRTPPTGRSTPSAASIAAETTDQYDSTISSPSSSVLTSVASSNSSSNASSYDDLTSAKVTVPARRLQLWEMKRPEMDGCPKLKRRDLRRMNRSESPY